MANETGEESHFNTKERDAAATWAREQGYVGAAITSSGSRIGLAEVLAAYAASCTAQLESEVRLLVVSVILVAKEYSK